MVKEVLVLVLFDCSLSVVAGCQPQLDQPLSTDAKSHVEVLIEGDGSLVGIDIDNAGKKLELNELILSKLPSRTETLSA